MVIVPTHSAGLPVRAPQEDRTGALLNRDRLSAADWPPKLRWILASRADRTVFFSAEPDLEYRVVGKAIDYAREAGASQIGVLGKPE